MSFNLELLKFFEYKHLPQHLQDVSAKFHDLAYSMNELYDKHKLDFNEANEGMRKLLEAKDCFVRSAVLMHNRDEKEKMGAVSGLRCLNCHSSNLATGRRPDGETTCLDCGKSWKTKEFRNDLASSK